MAPLSFCCTSCGDDVAGNALSDAATGEAVAGVLLAFLGSEALWEAKKPDGEF